MSLRFGTFCGWFSKCVSSSVRCMSGMQLSDSFQNVWRRFLCCHSRKSDEHQAGNFDNTTKCSFERSDMCNRSQEAVGHVSSGLPGPNGLLLRVSYRVLCLPSKYFRTCIQRFSTNFCNTDQIFRSNFTTLPIIECKAVKYKEYVAAACNTCVRKIEYVSFKSSPRGTMASFSSKRRLKILVST